jgi:hypothetical protein
MVVLSLLSDVVEVSLLAQAESTTVAARNKKSVRMAKDFEARK